MKSSTSLFLCIGFAFLLKSVATLYFWSGRGGIPLLTITFERGSGMDAYAVTIVYLLNVAIVVLLGIGLWGMLRFYGSLRKKRVR